MPFSRVGVCLLLLLSLPASVYSGHSPLDLIPKSAPLTLSLTISKDDEGVVWLVDRLKTYLLTRYSGEEGIEDFTFLDVDGVAFCILPQKSGTYDLILAARLIDRGEPMRIKSGKFDIRLNIRDKETARKFKRSILVSLLEHLIEKSSESSEKVTSARGDIEIMVKASSYAFVGDNVVVGSSQEAVSACRAAFGQKDERLSSSPAYADIQKHLSPLSSDLQVFIDNRGDDFKKYIALCRAEWGPLLLSMAESVNYLGVAVDIVDSNTMRARFVTHSLDKERAMTTQASAEARLPLFLKKYLGSEIECKYTMKRDGRYVVIDATVDGLSQYWDRVFGVKRREGGG